MFLETIFSQGLNGIRITVTTHISKTLAPSCYYRQPACYKFHFLPLSQVIYRSSVWLFYVTSCKCSFSNHRVSSKSFPLSLTASHPRPNKPIVLFEHISHSYHCHLLMLVLIPINVIYNWHCVNDTMMCVTWGPA